MQARARPPRKFSPGKFLLLPIAVPLNPKCTLTLSSADPLSLKNKRDQTHERVRSPVIWSILNKPIGLVGLLGINDFPLYDFSFYARLSILSITKFTGNSPSTKNSDPSCEEPERHATAY
jgi:hypothetical protein